MKLPKLRIDIGRLMSHADLKKDLVTYDSDIRGAAYIADDRDILIVSSTRGYYRLRQSDVDKLIEELTWIRNEQERRSRDP